MIPMPQNTFSMGFFFFYAIASSSRLLAATPADSCGDPATVNQAYAEIAGVVVDVLDAVTLTVDTQQPAESALLSRCSDINCRAKVRLVNLDSPSDTTMANAGHQALAAMLTSKRVSLMVSPVQNTAGVINAIVRLDERDINQQQLASGYAEYRNFGPYAIDWYLECRFLSAQRRARVTEPKS
jgi:endonuclease YncB( thermonuclease family)